MSKIPKDTNVLLKTWRETLLREPLTPEQEVRKCELQDELDAVALHLVSVDTVRRFKNREGTKVENTLLRIRNERSEHSKILLLRSRLLQVKVSNVQMSLARRLWVA